MAQGLVGRDAAGRRQVERAEDLARAALHARLETVFATRTRDDWAARFAGTEACVTPVLDFGEAAVVLPDNVLFEGNVAGGNGGGLRIGFHHDVVATRTSISVAQGNANYPGFRDPG